MTTLNAKANVAYHELIAEYEREHPDGVWMGFSHQRDAYEEGWENGFQAAGGELLKTLRTLRAGAITAERQDAYDKAIEAVEALA